jgi:hypothetical protein
MSLPQHVYHLAEAANWPLIQRDGLRCTASLLRHAKVRGATLHRHGHQQRPANVLLNSGATIRHQRPMPPKALERCLVDMTPAEWYALLNARVFFWPDVARLNRQRMACAADPQVLMVIDTAALLARHGDRAYVTPINTGNARRRAARRGRATFVPYHRWLTNRWTSEFTALGTSPRTASHPPAELTIIGDVPDVMDLVVKTTNLDAAKCFEAGDTGSPIKTE